MCQLPCEEACFICLSSSGVERCPRCPVSMCTRHKAVHTNPRGGCYPFRVEVRPNLGRILVATRTIRKGELIFRESPAVVGPYARTPRPQCLDCFRLLQQDGPGCPGCGFPVCGEDCPAPGQLHTAAECEVLARARGDIQYTAITVLRLLLLLQRERLAAGAGSHASAGEGEDYLLCLADSLMDHGAARRAEHREVWQWEEETMVAWLRDTCGLGHVFTAEEIHAAHGRILMNATSLDLERWGGELGRGAGLYPVYSMMNTSCRNNTVSTVLRDFRVEIRAKVRIAAGAEISNQYHAPATPTLLRRPLMRAKWLFDCSCARCRDPTELGTHYGSLVCARPRCGGAVVSSRPLDSEAQWQCQSCGLALAADTVRATLAAASASLDTRRGGDGVVAHYERWLHGAASSLHPGNYLVLAAKQRLALLYGNTAPFTINRMSRPARERKVQLCWEVAARLARLEQGLSEWRIAVLTELAKMTHPDSGYLEDNPDPDGRRGMVASFMLSDNNLSLANCLALCQ